MQALKSQVTQRAGCLFLSALLAFPTFALAQDQQTPSAPTSDTQVAPAPLPPPPAPSTGGWKRVGDQTAQNQAPSAPPSADSNAAPQAAPDNGNSVQAPPPPPPPPAVNANPNAQPQPYGGYPPPPNYNQGYPQAGYPQGGYPPQGYPQSQPSYPPMQNYQAQQPIPASLTIPSGTYLTVRINQMLSSDRNQVGDAFSATLQKPLVVSGVVIAEPGQTIGGHVAEIQKAGHVSGLARLGVQLTDLALVDGQQLPIKTSLVSRTGPSSVGQDAGTIIGTTGLGAAVGAAAAWGRGAAIGAGSGAVLGIIGVLVTRGHPSILYPEQILTFRIESPVTIDTTHAPQAFRYVQPGEFSQPGYGSYTSAPYPPAAAPAPYYYGYPYAYPYSYYAWGYPYYWGPGFSLFWGGRYWGGYRGGYYGVRGGGVVAGHSAIGGAGHAGGGHR